MIKTKIRHLMITGCRLNKAQFDRFGPAYERIIEIHKPTGLEEILSAGETVTDYILGGAEYIDAYALRRLNRLERLVLLGTGVPSFIDESAAAERGLAVMNTPHMNAESVAEFALAMLTVNASNAVGSADQVRTGIGWPQGPWKTLQEQRIGVFGLGHVGRALVRKLNALGVEKLFYASRHRNTEMELSHNLIFLFNVDLFKICDCISVHLSYNYSTHYIINRSLLESANRELIIQCFGNPRLIDPIAVRDALNSGKIQRLYMDGYYREWESNFGQAADPEGLLALSRDRFWATSHLAAQTQNVIDRQLERALELLILPEVGG